MKTMIWKIAILGVLISFFSCSTVPLTNRRQVRLLPEYMMLDMSLTSYDEFLSQNPPLPDDNKDVQKVRKVGENIAVAVADFLIENDLEKRIDDFSWDFNVVNDETINAWCMPGGKIVFYTGILSIASSDEEIAVVMGHEIAHALARHGNERMSQGMALQLGEMTLAAALQEKPELTQQIFLTSYGVGSSLGTLAYSRKHEYEADQIGMTLMAKAGYDPSYAVSFWQKMSENGGTATPELLSTHPSDAKRIAALKKHLPEAMKYYKGKKEPVKKEPVKL